MRSGKVADVDIVADAGAVGRLVIGAVDRDMVALADRRLGRDLDQVGRALADLPGAALRVGAGDVEIAQRAIVESGAPPKHR